LFNIDILGDDILKIENKENLLIVFSSHSIPAKVVSLFNIDVQRR